MRISQKLLLIFFVNTMLVVALISVVTHYNIASGFASYIAETELETLDSLPSLIVLEYQRTGNWQRIAENPDIFEELIRQNEVIHTQNPDIGKNSPILLKDAGQLAFDSKEQQPIDLNGGMPPGPGGSIPQALRTHLPDEFSAFGIPPGPPLAYHPPPPFPPFRLELLKRVGIFDQDGKLLWGTASSRGSKASLPLLQGEKRIGTLSIEPSSKLSKTVEKNFLKEQNRSLFLTSLVSLMLAGLSAMLLSRHIVSAINTLVQSTRKLIAGDYKSRVSIQRQDELGQLGADLNKLALALEKHDQVHKQWITDTSHELRTPVAVLRAQVEALQDGVQEPNQKTLAVLHAEVMSLARLIDDLHDLAKYDVEHLKFQKVPLDLGGLVRDTIASFEEAFFKKQIKIEYDSLKNLHCVIQGDHLKLKQLCASLLENSLRYTDEGGKLMISAEQGSEFVSIYFEDSEPGVPEELLQKIFERFYRVESSRSRVYGGSGLGLSVCKTIVEGHSGQIEAAQSALGGLRIEIKLPLTKEN